MTKKNENENENDFEWSEEDYMSLNNENDEEDDDGNDDENNINHNINTANNSINNRNDNDVNNASTNNKNNNNNNNSKNEVKKPLLINRILTEEDLSRLRELRVKNLMKLWNRKREEVGLKEEEDSDYEIRDNEIKSLTTIRLEAKERRKETALNKSSKQKTWQEYSKKKRRNKIK